MPRKRRSSGERKLIEFELESFEFVRASASSALVRVCGRWRADDPRWTPVPVLTVVSDGERHRLQPVAGTPTPRAELAANVWAGGFASPMELVDSGEAWTIEMGTEVTFALPELRERGRGIDPLSPPSPEQDRPSELELARQAAAQERALADRLHEELRATTDVARARNEELSASLAEMAERLARFERERDDGERSAQSRGRIAAEQDRASDLETLEREAREARRMGEEAQAELARVSAAHETALARNREVEGLLLVVENRARELERRAAIREDDMEARLNAATEKAAPREGEVDGRPGRVDRRARIRRLLQAQEEPASRRKQRDALGQRARELEARAVEANEVVQGTERRLAERPAAAHLDAKRLGNAARESTQDRGERDEALAEERERIKELDREARDARRAEGEAQAELARVSVAHETALARNREVEGLLLLAEQRARKLEVGWELDMQDRLAVARRVAATREADRARGASERRLAERKAGARKSVQRINALDQALARALVEERERVEELERKIEQTDRAGEKTRAQPARQSGKTPRVDSKRPVNRKDDRPSGKRGGGHGRHLLHD